MFERNRSRSQLFVRAILLAFLAGSALPHECAAKVADVEVTEDAEMRFGAFAVFGRGARSLSAYGGVSDEAIFPIPGSVVAPAQFTVSFDRGNESRRPIDVEIQLLLLDPGPVVQGGVSATLSNLATDLPGAASLIPGQPIILTLQRCVSRICSRTFRLGGRLEIARSSGGAQLRIPLMLEATLVSASRD